MYIILHLWEYDMGWVYLGIAIISDVLATIFLKLSDGLSNTFYSIGTLILYFNCFLCLSLALKMIDVSIAYAVWAGLGVILISVIGIIFFNEPINAIKIISTILIVVGVVGLKLSSLN